MRKEKIVAILLALFLGALGVHAFYLDDKHHGLTLLVLTLIGWLLAFVVIGIIPLIISSVWAFVDFIRLCVMRDDDFNEKYNMPEEKIVDISE